MKRKRVFESKIVYYIAVVTSLVLFVVSAISIFSLFDNFNIIKLVIIGVSIIINAFAFINLVEKYDKAVFYLNIGLSIYTVIISYFVLIIFLKRGVYDIFNYPYFKFWITFIIILLVVNKYKVRDNGEHEIEEIGKHKE